MTVRETVARTLVPYPFSKVARDALAAPVTGDPELDQLLADRIAGDVKLIDYIASQRAKEVVDAVDLRQLLRDYLGSEGGRKVVAWFLTDPEFSTYLNRVVEERIRITPRRDRWHVPNLFGWLGGIVGAVIGFVLGLVFNLVVDATPVNGTMSGKQVVVGSALDTLPIQVLVVLSLVVVGGAFGAAVFHRQDATPARS